MSQSSCTMMLTNYFARRMRNHVLTLKKRHTCTCSLAVNNCTFFCCIQGCSNWSMARRRHGRSSWVIITLPEQWWNNFCPTINVQAPLLSAMTPRQSRSMTMSSTPSSSSPNFFLLTFRLVIKAKKSTAIFSLKIVKAVKHHHANGKPDFVPLGQTYSWLKLRQLWSMEHQMRQNYSFSAANMIGDFSTR